MLHYYHAMTDPKPRMSLSLDHYFISRPTLVEIRFRKDIPCFALVPTRQTERTYVFSAVDEKTVEEWIAAFNSLTPNKNAARPPSQAKAGALNPPPPILQPPPAKNNINKDNKPISNPASPALSNSPRSAAPTPIALKANPAPESANARTIMSNTSAPGDGAQTIVGGIMSNAPRNNQQTIVGGTYGNYGGQTIVGGQSQLGGQTIVGGHTIVGNSALAANNATIVGGNLRDVTNEKPFGGHQAPVGARLVAMPPVNVLRMIPDLPNMPEFERKVTHTVIKIGRAPAPENIPPELFIAFPTKVVSRMHAELWTSNGEFYLRDTKSQSGTFLNAMRLGEPGKESKPFKIRTGDIIQFGVDFRGTGDAPIPDDSRCVSVKVECLSIQEPPRYILEDGSETPMDTFASGASDRTITGGNMLMHTTREIGIAM